MATLKELIELSGVQQIAPNRTIGGQVYDSSINTVSQDTDLGSDTYAGSITPYSDNVDPFYSGLMKVTEPIRNTFNKYAPQIAGGLASLAGIPGVNFLLNLSERDPYAQNRIDMFGAYRGKDGFMKDKFGYNVGQTLNIPFLPFTKNRFMEPGSNSFRSYALEGLGSLDPIAADQFYQQTYGKSYDDVKRDIQRKQDPFSQQNVFEGTSDYQGDGGSGGQGGVQSSGFADDGGPVSNRTGRGRQGY